MHHDDELILKIMQGDNASTQLLYRQHEQHWFRLCLRYGRNRMEAQDILQEGLILVFRDLGQFDLSRGTFPNWSNRVMVNAALRYLKKHQWQQSFEDLSDAEQELDFSESALERLTAKELTQIIQELPTGYRLVFNMYVIEGYSHVEIAAILGVSVGTSKSQLSKAKKALREKLEVLF